MIMNSIALMFQQLFGAKQDEFAGLDGPQREILDQLIDFVVENIDPRICVVPDYRKRLVPAVAHAVAHLRRIIMALPAPIELTRSAWANDATVNAFFAVADDISRVFGHSHDLREFFEDADHRGLDEAYALLVMDKRENTVLGTALENGVLRRDVPQTTLGFSNHRILAPAVNLREARIAVGTRGLQRILDVALQKIAAMQEQASDLEERKAFLATRLRLLKSPGFGIEPHSDRGQEIMQLESRLAETAQALSTHKLAAHSMAPYLEQIIEVLTNAEQFLTSREVMVRVNRMGVVVSGDTQDVSHDLMFTELTLGVELNAVIVMVKCRREEMPSRESLFAEAEKYLL